MFQVELFGDHVYVLSYPQCTDRHVSIVFVEIVQTFVQSNDKRKGSYVVIVFAQ
jgi:hypothetical protein